MQDNYVVVQFKNDMYSKLSSLYSKYQYIKNELSKTNDLDERKKIQSNLSELIREYNLFSDMYHEIAAFKTSSEVLRYIENIKLQSSNILREYEELKVKYNNGVRNKIDVESLNKIALRANEILKINSTYSVVISIYENVLADSMKKTSDVKKKIKDNAAKTSEKKSNFYKKSEEKKPKKSYTGDVDVVNLHTINRKIQMLKDMYFKTDKDLPDHKKIQMLIYDLCSQREEMITKLLGYEDANNIIKIESMEDAAFSKSDTPIAKSFTLTSSGFTSEFNNLISDIGEMEFDGVNSKTFSDYKKKNSSLNMNDGQLYKMYYDELIRKYHNILNALVSNDKSLSSMGDDLLGTLRLFNVNGGYARFKNKHKTGKIGSEAISKEMYQEGRDRIDNLVNSISHYAIKFISKNNGRLVVVDKEKTRSQRIDEINKKYFEIYDKIIETKKRSVTSNL